MQAFPHQLVLTSAVIAAAMILGSVPARAGYISVPASRGADGVSTLAHPFASLLAEPESTGDMAGAGAGTGTQPDVQDRYAPLEPVSPLGKLRQAAYNFRPAGGAGTSSSSGSSSGPSTSPAGDVSRPQVPPLELVGLLPPPTGEAPPLSVAFFLFRPPRVA